MAKRECSYSWCQAADRVGTASSSDNAVVGGSEPSLGILLSYPEPSPESLQRRRARTVALPPLAATLAPAAAGGAPSLSVIGAGNYAGAVLVLLSTLALVRFLYPAGPGIAFGLDSGQRR